MNDTSKEILETIVEIVENLKTFDLDGHVKSIGLGLIFFLMMIILVGIPAGSFTKNIFLADFYGRRVK